MFFSLSFMFFLLQNQRTRGQNRFCLVVAGVGREEIEEGGGGTVEGGGTGGRWPK
jgi:hypothetical protein